MDVGGLERGRGEFEVIEDGVALFGGAFVFLLAEGLGEVGRKSAAGGDGESEGRVIGGAGFGFGVGPAFLGPGILSGGKGQAETADGGAAEFGIVMEAHGDDGIGGGAEGFGEAEGEEGIVFFGDGDAPAGLGIAIDDGHGRVFDAFADAGGGGEDEGQLAGGAPGVVISASTSVSTKRSAPRAKRLPGRLSSWKTSRPRAVQAPSPGLKETV